MKLMYSAKPVRPRYESGSYMTAKILKFPPYQCLDPKPKNPLKPHITARGVLKVRMRQRISARGNIYYVVYVGHIRYGTWTGNQAFGWSMPECWKDLERLVRDGYDPQRKLCQLKHAQA